MPSWIQVQIHLGEQQRSFKSFLFCKIPHTATLCSFVPVHFCKEQSQYLGTSPSVSNATMLLKEGNICNGKMLVFLNSLRQFSAPLTLNSRGMFFFLLFFLFFLFQWIFDPGPTWSVVVQHLSGMMQNLPDRTTASPWMSRSPQIRGKFSFRLDIPTDYIST